MATNHGSTGTLGRCCKSKIRIVARITCLWNIQNACEVPTEGYLEKCGVTSDLLSRTTDPAFDLPDSGVAEEQTERLIGLGG